MRILKLTQYIIIYYRRQILGFLSLHQQTFCFTTLMSEGSNAEVLSALPGRQHEDNRPLSLCFVRPMRPAEFMGVQGISNWFIFREVRYWTNTSLHGSNAHCPLLFSIANVTLLSFWTLKSLNTSCSLCHSRVYSLSWSRLPSDASSLTINSNTVWFTASIANTSWYKSNVYVVEGHSHACES